MIEEKTKKRIGELRENGLTISEVAKALEVSESTVQRYDLDNHEKDIKEKITTNKTISLNGSWMAQLFGEEWNDDIDLIQLFFDLNRLANETEKELYNFLKTIKFIITQYYRYSDTPLKLFDIFLDISSNIKFFEEGYDMKEVAKVFEKIYDQHIFIEDLEKKYNSIEEFKKTKEKEIEEITQFQEHQFEKSLKILNQLKEINQTLSNAVIRAKNIIMSQKEYFRKKVKKLLHPQKIIELKRENYAMNHVLKEFEQRYPNEVKTYIEEIKNAEF